ncbi:UDP-glucose 6-dehydrogenase [Burkholderia sp. SG-MS1]|uniref:UDP-glucose dehydrogenase family protein n=1 Tax=Paraburkholderia sp. SG-MS1 TaxID=2023741 RepID=UPI0014455FDA|nr:UDP-glucose/GDP-mannose dehydrogenase family protein [Paraburkholderia sp. SG-MS1]NKJ45215.1 UDP-glucose 6-dehydrogenase [Paraburkholderia sp. SG-MS1]
MKITVVGTGYVGLVTGACLAEIGNDVICLDLDASKISMLNCGEIPIHEQGLEDIIARNVRSKRLRFSTDIAAAVAHGEFQFIAVGTPPDEDGAADLQHVLAAAINIASYMNEPKIVVGKSTVPVGTGERVKRAIADVLAKRGVTHSFAVVSNPEFLKEGAAVEDFMRPHRIVIGSDDDEASVAARERMRLLYEPFNRNHERTLYMDLRSAEFTKYAANAMLATRISFMNELANLADRVDVDIESVRRGIGSDPRIGYDFLYAGCGYGGSCFPKDVRALVRTANDVDCQMRILSSVEEVNAEQRKLLAYKVIRRFGQDLSGKRFGLWGLAFKPNTDDMREATSRVLIRALLSRGASVAAYDPVAIEEAARVIDIDLGDDLSAKSRLSLVADKLAAIEGADALIVVTEWQEFKSLNFAEIGVTLKHPIIFDGRNLYEPEDMARLGFEYYGVGRSNMPMEKRRSTIRSPD